MLSTARFILFYHPLINVLSVILLSTTSFLLLLNTQSSIFMSYILFLIIVGGLLIVFRYVSALVPDELFLVPRLGIRLLLTTLILIIIRTENNNTLKFNIIKHLEIFSVIHLNKIICTLLAYILIIICLVMFIIRLLKSPIKKITYDLTENTPNC